MLTELLSVLLCATVGYAFGWKEYLYFGMLDYELKWTGRFADDWYTNAPKRCAVSCAIRGAGIGILAVSLKSIFF